MAEFTANALQLVATNANVLFTEAPVPGRGCVYHREGSGLVILKGNGRCRPRFKVFFSGNIAIPDGGTVGPISLAITLNGEPIASTTMISTPTAAGDFNNVSSAIFIDVPCGVCDVTLAVQNTSTLAIDVQNANFVIERVA